MEHRDDIIDFSELINKVYFQVLSYLPLEYILETRITCRKIKEVVETYIRKHRPIFLRRLPPNTIYTAQNIVNACLYLVCKQPEECNTTLNCTVSSKSLAPESIEINPSLETLRVIGMSGVKTELNIQFDLVNMTSFKDNIQILEQIIESLPHTQSIYIRFSESKYYSERGDWVAGTWFNKTARALINLQELSSLRISGDAPWEHILDCLPHLINLRKLRVTGNRKLDGVKLLERLSQMTKLTSLSISRIRTNATELTDCLRLMPQLGSLSISRVEIDGLEYEDLGKNLESALPNLRELALRHVHIENEEDEGIEALLPHIRNLLSQLTSLDLSNNTIEIDDGEGNGIVPAMRGYVSNLKSLNLSYNYIGQSYSSKYGPHPIIKLFKSLPNLQELNLEHNEINSCFIAVLIPTLKKLPLLRKLNLSRNYLSILAIVGISKWLPDLKLVDITDNFVGFELPEHHYNLDDDKYPKIRYLKTYDDDEEIPYSDMEEPD